MCRPTKTTHRWTLGLLGLALLPLVACQGELPSVRPAVDAHGVQDLGGGPSADLPGAVGDAWVKEPAVYVHDTKRLFRLDPKTLSFSVIGDFDCVHIDSGKNLNDENTSCCIGMTDIAISRTGRIVGTLRDAGNTDYQLVEIDPKTAHCSVIGTIGAVKIKGLTFLPIGALDANAEALVGIDLSCGYWRIDASNGTPTKIADLTVCSAKGADMVSIAKSETFIVGGGELRAMNPKTGEITRTIGKLSPDPGGYPSAGLGYWGGTVYGFTLDGKVFAIDDKTAATTEVKLVGDLPAQFSFANEGVMMFTGAGATTIAPTIL